MQKFLNTFALLAAVISLAVANRQASAETISGTVTLINPGFESPELTVPKIGSGWDTLGKDIPGWTNGTVSGVTYPKGYTDTGVQKGTGQGYGGSNQFASVNPVDADGGSLCQLTSQKIATASDTYTLTFYAKNATTVLATIYYVNDSGVRVTLGSATETLTTSWVQYSLTATATTASVGKYVGVYFSNTSASNYLRLDDVALTYTTVPEPSTFIMVGSGVVALLAFAWRKRRKQY